MEKKQARFTCLSLATAGEQLRDNTDTPQWGTGGKLPYSGKCSGSEYINVLPRWDSGGQLCGNSSEITLTLPSGGAPGNKRETTLQWGTAREYIDVPPRWESRGTAERLH